MPFLKRIFEIIDPSEYGHLMGKQEKSEKMDALKIKSEKGRFAAQAFYRPAQKETAEKLWDSQPQPFYHRNQKNTGKAGAYPQGFYRTDSAMNFY